MSPIICSAIRTHVPAMQHAFTWLSQTTHHWKWPQSTNFPMSPGARGQQEGRDGLNGAWRDVLVVAAPPISYSLFWSQSAFLGPLRCVPVKLLEQIQVDSFKWWRLTSKQSKKSSWIWRRPLGLFLCKMQLVLWRCTCICWGWQDWAVCFWLFLTTAIFYCSGTKVHDIPKVLHCQCCFLYSSRIPLLSS